MKLPLRQAKYRKHLSGSFLFNLSLEEHKYFEYHE